MFKQLKEEMKTTFKQLKEEWKFMLFMALGLFLQCYVGITLVKNVHLLIHSFEQTK